jgi:general secretion pathway protein G
LFEIKKRTIQRVNLGGKKMKAKKGFTLVEILIVVVILGILAAIVIPQFTEASTEARASTMVSDLQTMRSQLELYKIQHRDTLPALATFTAKMTTYSDIDGNTNATKTSVFKFGPYLQKIPTNPFNTSNAILAALPSNGSATGWSYTAASGAFYAGNDTDLNDQISDAELVLAE